MSAEICNGRLPEDVSKSDAKIWKSLPEAIDTEMCGEQSLPEAVSLIMDGIRIDLAMFGRVEENYQ